MHKSVTLFLLFSSDKLRKEINKVSRIKLAGTEDHCTYANFIFMSIWLVFLLLKDEFSDLSFQFFFLYYNQQMKINIFPKFLEMYEGESEAT